MQPEATTTSSRIHSHDMGPVRLRSSMHACGARDPCSNETMYALAGRMRTEFNFASYPQHTRVEVTNPDIKTLAKWVEVITCLHACALPTHATRRVPQELPGTLCICNMHTFHGVSAAGQGAV